MARYGRMLAFGGLAAAGMAWFGRRKRDEATGMQEQVSETEPAATRDPIDEAIAESFPASDPPSFAGSTSSAEDEGTN